MKHILLICFVFLSLSVKAQNDSLKIAQTDSVLLTEVMSEIEQKTDYHFFYRKKWVENRYVPQRQKQESESIETFLKELLKSTSLSFYIDKKKIILVNNTVIITNPAITKYNKKSENIDNTIDFLQEQNINAENIEEKIFHIGNRKKYQKNAKNTIAGYIRETGTNKPVSRANVFISNPLIGTSSGEDGFFSLTIPSGKHQIFIQSLGMKKTSRQVVLYSDGRLDIDLEVEVMELETITINAERDANISSINMGLAKIDIENLKTMPALLGERDFIKVSTTTAGVQYLGEGSAGINVRGGKADQNLFLLDGTPVYNTNHFFGFFSIFNSSSLSGMELYKSAIPAEYGGRLSAVFDVKTKKPNAEKFSGSAGVGPVTSNLVIETPIIKDKTSLMIGGRATYSDYVLQRIKNSPLKNNNANFYDFIGKIEHQFNKNNTLSVTGYYSFDSFQLSSDTLLSYTNFDYSNRLLAVNWNKVFNEKLQVKFQAGISDYQYKIGYDVLPTQAFDINYGVNEKHFSAKFDYYINDKLNYKFGLQFKHTKVNPGIKSPLESSTVQLKTIEQEQGIETVPYFSVLYSPSDKLSVEGGIRFSIFNVLGSAQVSEYDSEAPRNTNSITDTKTYDDGEIIKTYAGAEYRFSSRYTLSTNSSIKGSYNRTRQNIHLLSNSASVGPTDMWRLSSSHIKPQIADQYSIGYYKNFDGKKEFETSLEVYYKDIQNLLDFKVGADLLFNENIETDLLQGDGKSYGAELSIKKTSGWLTGWLNYTYSKSLIQLNGNHPEEIVNGGIFFPTGYDKPHYFNSITNYKFTRRLTMSVGLTYATGVPITYPVGKWNFKSSENILYSDRNSFRIPDYFRMDLGLNVEGSHKRKKIGHAFWSFSIYNLLSRDNVYSIFFKVEDGEVKGYKMTVFSTPIPTITYNFTF